MDGLKVTGLLSANRRPSVGGVSPDENVRKTPHQVSQVKKQAVKRHHHKHNLKHRVRKERNHQHRCHTTPFKVGVAIKSIRKEKIKDEQDLVHIRREIEIMSTLCHPHIITIYEVFENKDKIVIVMEYASRGDLYDYICDKRNISEREARHFFRQIVSAVHYCHQIADFGLSNLYHCDEYLQTFCGSPLYASPEIVNGRPYRGPEVDTWSLGVLLYTMVHGTMPFDGHNHKALVQQISTGNYRKPNNPSDACGLIRWMLMVNPERRATIEEIAGHWWLNWGYQQPLLAETKSSPVEQAALPVSPSTSHTAGLASVASWLRRTSRPLLENGSKMRCLLRPQGGGGDVVRQRSLRRSRKENNVSQTVHEASTDSRPSKGILKRRNSVKQKATSEASAAGSVEPHSILGLSAAASAPSAALQPRKGILKKPSEQESGYYSSSPENSDCGWTPQTKECPSAPIHRKGILKRNGKFSSGGLQEFGSLDQLAASLPRGGIRSRPSGAISEDSILSSESFDQLDLPDRVGPPRQMDKPAKTTMRGCVSADNLLDIQEDGILGDGSLRPWNCYKSGVADSAFSITDCDNVTEAYKQAMVIRGSAAS
ncbi:NUAK family SNF1-like kinase 2 [Collichthys lucidus]|uniref:non-specific serine/threonine protein kinase n=1 Tax=Collichthys lucidus TaxID=240159 RepID=A0A4U5UBQ3_COLLU|nr:NUAK family SNF1-like kinase 2 [Collichthys lucidus]